MGHERFGIAEAHRAGFTGAGCRLAIVERGWDVDPAVMPRVEPTGLVGLDGHAHGRATLTITLGIAPDVELVRLYSQWRAHDCYDTASALAAIASDPDIRAGDVVLVEAQTGVTCGCGSWGGLPVDVHPDVAREVDGLISGGRTVVLAGGNGGLDLEAAGHPGVAHGCAVPRSRGQRVGAAREERGRWVVDRRANRGSSCWSGPGRWGPVTGTSAAAAVVAGLLCVVAGAGRSGVAWARTGIPVEGGPPIPDLRGLGTRS